MRGILERRYLTEKYQRKQVRLAYEVMYDKPYDRERYIRTKFARKRRFVDILCGNYVKWANRWEEARALNSNGWRDRHTFTKAELGRLRNVSFDTCRDKKCGFCSNPRKGYGYQSPKELRTRQENIALLQMKEELDFYRQGERYETFEDNTAR